MIPAVTRQVSRRVTDVPARTERREIPAVYDTVTVQKLVDPARIERIAFASEFGSVEKRVQLTPEKAEWRQVLCEANSNAIVIRAIQRELQTRGYYQSALDGVLGQSTYAAGEQFHIQQGLSTGERYAQLMPWVLTGVQWSASADLLPATPQAVYQVASLQARPQRQPQQAAALADTQFVPTVLL